MKPDGRSSIRYRPRDWSPRSASRPVPGPSTSTVTPGSGSPATSSSGLIDPASPFSKQPRAACSQVRCVFRRMLNAESGGSLNSHSGHRERSSVALIAARCVHPRGGRGDAGSEAWPSGGSSRASATRPSSPLARSTRRSASSSMGSTTGRRRSSASAGVPSTSNSTAPPYDSCRPTAYVLARWKRCRVNIDLSRPGRAPRLQRAVPAPPRAGRGALHHDDRRGFLSRVGV